MATEKFYFNVLTAPTVPASSGNLATDVADNATDIADNSADITTNSTDIATNTSAVATNLASITALNNASHDALTIASASVDVLSLPAGTQELDLKLSADASNVLQIVSDGLLVEESRALIRLQTDSGGDHAVDLNVTVPTAINFNGGTLNRGNGYLSVVGTAGIKTNYTGFIDMSYTLPLTSTGEDVSIKSYIRRNRGGSLVEFCHDFSFSKASTGITHSCNNGKDLLDCADGDVFNLIVVRNGTATDVVNLSDRANFVIKKYI